MIWLRDCQRTALVTRDGEISYADLLREIGQYHRLIAPAPESRVAFFAENSPAWVQAFYGAWEGGAINVPIDALSPADEVRFILEDCRPETVCYSARTEAALTAALRDLAHPPRLIRLDDANLPPAAVESTSFPEFPPERTAIILYTSGTTGGPKGVMLTFDNLAANVEGVSIHSPIFTAGQRTMVLLPLHHILPLMGSVIAPLFSGGTLVFCPSLAPPDILETLRVGQVTIMIGVPRLYHLLHRGIMEKVRSSLAGRVVFFLAGLARSARFSRRVFHQVHEKFGGHMRFLVSGGAALDPVVHRDFLTLGFDLLNGYGMTETAPMITFTRPGRAKVGSAGQAIAGCRIKLEDGEILVSGRNVMPGYYHRPDETAEVMNGSWLRTGDLGHLDADGHLFVTGRRKEIIVLSNGKNVNPEEIEKKILALTDVITEIGVYAQGDALRAVILPDLARARERGMLNIEAAIRGEVLEAYNKSVAPYKRILRFSLVREELPKTRLGKLKRFRLEAFAAAPPAEHPQAEEPEGAEYQALKGFLERQTERPVHPHDHIEIDLGLDSLDKVTLIVFFSSVFGIELTEQDLARHSTVAALAAYAAEHKTRLETEETDWSAILRAGPVQELPRSTVLHLTLKHLSGLLLRLCFRVRVRGLENIPRPPFILTPNHQSVADGLLAAVCLTDDVLRQTFFFAKEKHFRGGFMRYLAERCNIIVMNIDLDLRGALRKMAGVLRAGKSIIVFPEGTRTRDGSVGAFKMTFAIVSRETGVPVVPVAISGAFKALPRGSRLPRPWTRIEVTFLPPLLPANLSYEEIRDTVRARIAAHVN